MTTRKIVDTLLADKALCDHCLGRQFALLGTGTTNVERGFALKMVALLEAHKELSAPGRKGKKARDTLELLATHGQFKPAQDTLKKNDPTRSFPIQQCDLCEDLFQRIPVLLEKTTAQLEKKKIEYHTFLVGSYIPERFVEAEDAFRGKHELIHGEALKREFNREFGKVLSHHLKKEPVFDHPDLLIKVNLKTGSASFQISPLFIAGRYLKKIRGIPQTKWPCQKCNGRGCKECKGTGKMYPESVEELIAAPILTLFNGRDERFHAAGREDIDARMLGTGRPFVLEILAPQNRTVDLAIVEKAVNKSAKGKVAVKELWYSTKAEARTLKANSSQSHKTYKAEISVKHPVSREQLAELDKTLAGALLHQRTPTRVSHRRADLTRKKRIYTIKTQKIKKNKIETTITCQGGLYVKELISGDGGRTRPNFTDILKTPAECIALDVIEVATEAYHNGKKP